MFAILYGGDLMADVFRRPGVHCCTCRAMVEVDGSHEELMEVLRKDKWEIIACEDNVPIWQCHDCNEKRIQRPLNSE